MGTVKRNRSTGVCRSRSFRSGCCAVLGLGLLTAALIGATPKATLAQSIRIDEIKQLLGGKATSVDTTTPSVQRRNVGDASWDDLGAQALIQTGQQIRVEQNHDVRGLVGDNHLVFLTNLRDKRRANAFGFASMTDASYIVSQDAGGPLVVDVERGCLVVSWDRSQQGALTVIAAGAEIDVVGTEFVVQVNAAGDSASIFVTEGTVAVSSATSGQLLGNVGESQVWHVETNPASGQAQLRQDPSVSNQAVNTMTDAVAYHGSDVWKGWFARNALWVVPTGIGVGVGTYFVVDALLGGDKSGVVVLTIPF